MSSNAPPIAQQKHNLAAYELRHYLTAEEQRELDRLLWSPQRERTRYRHDPVAFAKEVLHMDLAPYQADVLASLYTHRRVAFVGPRGTGKSTTAAAAILWFIAVFDECKVPTTASAWRQLVEFLWPEIHKWALQADWWRVGLEVRAGKELLAQRLEIEKNRSAFAMASSNEAKIEGAHSAAVLMVFDESKAIPDSIWDSAEGALGTGEWAFALAMSTPGDNVGRFYDIFHERDKFKHWHIIQASLQDAVNAGRVKEEWAEMMSRQWGKDSVMYKRHVLGIFAEDAGDTLITMSQVERAQERWHILEAQVKSFIDEGMSQAEAEQLVWGDVSHIGCDPAREGRDKTGWAFRYGDTGIRHVYQTEQEDTMVTADRLQAHMDGNSAIAKIDANGLGAGVFDRIRQLWNQHALRSPHDARLPATPINTTNATKARDKSGQMSFNRLRDYLWWNMRELLEADVMVLPPDKDLARDLVAAKWWTTAGGKIQVESKIEVRKRLGRSPDVGDAVVMACAPDTPTYKPMIGFF